VTKSRSTEAHTDRMVSLLLSIRPQHANRIFEGSKHYELRKVLPKARFARVFLYETGGAGIVGWFDVADVLRKPIDELWNTVGTAATTREAFYTYFAPVEEGYAIKIREAYKFKKPINASRLNGDRLKLLPPQSFIVLEKGQPLHMILEAERRAHLREDLPRLTLKQIEKSQRPRYKELVLKHISPHYDNIDESFVDATLRAHDLGADPVGFFTRKKEVLAIYNSRNACIGFTTLTYKSGDCVKTGPTVLLSQYRGKGYGQATRKALEERLLRTGARKIYCTCPERSEETLRYLLASGMRVEAHLEYHYASTHHELVLGKLLVSDENSVPAVHSFEQTPGVVSDPNSFKRTTLLSAISAMFERTWPPVSKQFVGRLLEESLDTKAIRFHEKPKRLVCLRNGEACVAAIVLLPKRGGAVKGLIVRSTNHESSLRALCDQAIEEVSRLGGRKFYFLHPIADASAVVFLKSYGFRPEGLLRAPYVPGQDAIVMSRFI